MRLIGLLGLVLALALVGLLAKRQLAGLAPTALPQGAAPAGAALPPATAREQGQRLQQQLRQSLDAAMQPRPLPDEN